MAHPNVELMRKIDEAQVAGDIDTFFGYFTDDIKLHIGGRNSLTGDYEGKDKFQEVFGKFNEAVGDYSFENHSYLADDEHGITLQTGKMQRDGKSLEVGEIFIVHFSGGKASEVWYVSMDQAAFDSWIG